MSSQNIDQETVDQLDKVLEDLSTDNEIIIFMLNEHQVSIQGIIYELKRNFKEAFQIESFKDRFVDVFFDYDYIVGDFSGNLLRLRGFYDEGRNNAPLDQTITRLEDYLMESVNFGAPYFVLERSEKIEVLPIEKRDYSRSQSNQRNKNRKKRQHSGQKRNRKERFYSKKGQINKSTGKGEKPRIQRVNKDLETTPKDKIIEEKAIKSTKKTFQIVRKEENR